MYRLLMVRCLKALPIRHADHARRSVSDARGASVPPLPATPSGHLKRSVLRHSYPWRQDARDLPHRGMGERPSQATFWVRDPGLGRGHGQDGTAARLLPLSVDGLILGASLVLLDEARNDRDAPGLARFMLWPGIGANIAYGAGNGLLGALIPAWPAVAFIGAAEIAMQQVRRVRGPGAATSGPWLSGSACPAARSASFVAEITMEGNGHVSAGKRDPLRRQHDALALDKQADWIEEHIAALRREGRDIFVDGQPGFQSSGCPPARCRTMRRSCSA